MLEKLMVERKGRIGTTRGTGTRKENEFNKPIEKGRTENRRKVNRRTGCVRDTKRATKVKQGEEKKKKSQPLLL